ncbi:hypothetical protein CANINC_004428 [Pichia inconspicua]|uniref:RanBP2-type domain-containing protein n=1 Tax=Pichia inconspicua TaxID=52247 RepID=A0A4T0WW92_9ASCO|nr:hypothetical protein CANINC_004428 [[Candida] inconspicua]
MTKSHNTRQTSSKVDALNTAIHNSAISFSYVFLDVNVDDNDINDLRLTGASYSIVTAETFKPSVSSKFELKGSNDELKTVFQKFIQSLTDSIYSHCIQNDKKVIFVVTSGWNLRIRLIKLAKTLRVQLPIYFEYPSYFDLKKEFIKYEELIEKVPFNYIDYNNTSLDNMGKTLGIEKIDDNIELMISIACKLNSNEKSISMKNPHDMNLDLTHFFMEQSKILYMNNLSSDITQAELETFFMRFSGNALAFWMLKNPILLDTFSPECTTNNIADILKTTSGFVIFSSHQDATEALMLSGEMLNDRLIELQPSSLTVLEKARDILSPFPSSKNKPRPGDWNCPSCGFSNFQRRTACFRCTFPAASAATVQESIYAGEDIMTNNQKPRNELSPMNNYTGYYSNVGNANLNGFVSNYNNTYGNNNFNTSGSTNGNNSSYSSRQSSNVPFRAGDWKCVNEACCYHNFAKNTCCLKCGALRVQSTIMSGHPHGQFNHIGDKNNTKLNRSMYVVDSNNSSRSSSIPNQMNQLNQHQIQNQNQTQNLQNIPTFNNFGKTKNNANEVFMNSVPNTPSVARSGIVGYSSNSASNSTDFLASKIGNLSLNHNNTGSNGVGSSISGNSGNPLNSSKLESVGQNLNSNISGFNTSKTPFGINYGLSGGNSLFGLGSNDIVSTNAYEMNAFTSGTNYDTLNSLGGLSRIGGGLNKASNLEFPSDFDSGNIGLNTDLKMGLNMGGYGKYNYNGLGNDAFSVKFDGTFGEALNSSLPASENLLSVSKLDNTIDVSKNFEGSTSN